MDADHFEYWKRVGAKVSSHVHGQRDQAFDQALIEGLALYSFITEDFRAKTTKNTDLVEKLGAMLILTQDILRGLLAAHRELSPVSLATLTRVAAEVHFNLRFIVSGPDPAKYADRYFRYQEIEKLIHDSKRPQSELSMLSPGTKDEIKKTCPEWIKPSGEFRTYWTAEPTLMKIAQVAKAAGLEDDYRDMYSTTSKFVHGSALVTNLYRGPHGVGAVGQRALCKQLATLALGYCTKNLKDFCEFFGVKHDEMAIAHWQHRLLEACQDVLPPGQ